MPRAGESDLTREQLAAGLQRLRRRLRHLPEDLDAALALPGIAACIRGTARDIEREARAPTRRTARPIAPPVPVSPPAWDARRAAAGDLGD